MANCAGLKKRPYKPNNNKLKYAWLLKLDKSIIVSEELTKERVACSRKEILQDLTKKANLLLHVVFCWSIQNSSTSKASEEQVAGFG